MRATAGGPRYKAAVYTAVQSGGGAVLPSSRWLCCGLLLQATTSADLKFHIPAGPYLHTGTQHR